MRRLELGAPLLVLACAATSTPPALAANSLVLAYFAAYILELNACAALPLVLTYTALRMLQV